MSKMMKLEGEIEVYDIEKFKNWLFEELQNQEFVGIFDIGFDCKRENE